MKISIQNEKTLTDNIISISRALKLNAFVKFKEYIKKDLSVEEILHNILEAELSIKTENKYRYRIKNANFPVIKTLVTTQTFPRDLANGRMKLSLMCAMSPT